MARGAGFLRPEAEEILPAPLAAGAVGVVPAAGAVAAVAGGTVELGVEVALLRAATAVTGCQRKHRR